MQPQVADRRIKTACRFWRELDLLGKAPDSKNSTVAFLYIVGIPGRTDRANGADTRRFGNGGNDIADRVKIRSIQGKQFLQ